MAHVLVLSLVFMHPVSHIFRLLYHLLPCFLFVTMFFSQRTAIDRNINKQDPSADPTSGPNTMTLGNQSR